MLFGWGHRAIVVSLLIVLCRPGAVRAQAPDDPTRLSQEASKALAEQRYADAERAFEQLRKLSPAVAEVHASLGFVYFQQGKFSQAVTSLQQALKLQPSLPNARVLLAMSLSELGRFEEALPGLEQGFKQGGDARLRRAAGLQLLRAYTGLQRDADAVNVALQMTRLYPKDPEVLYHSSRLHANYAYLTLRQLAEAAPDSLWVHLAAGEASESQSQYDVALTEYRAALALDPNRAGIHFRLGRVLLALYEQGSSENARQGEALKEFQQELQSDPTNANAAYEIAEIHRKSGDLAEARTFFETALEHYPDFADAQIGLGRSLIALKEPKLAISHLEKAIALDPSSEVAYYQLAQAYRAMGDTAAQQKALARFQELRSASERASPSPMLSRPEVTKQKLEPGPKGESVPR